MRYVFLLPAVFCLLLLGAQTVELEMQYLMRPANNVDYDAKYAAAYANHPYLDRLSPMQDKIHDSRDFSIQKYILFDYQLFKNKLGYPSQQKRSG